MLSGGGVKIKLEDFQPVHERCTGCAKTVNDGDFERCGVYINPSSWWANNKRCPLLEKDTISVQDVVKMAIEAGIIEKDGDSFIYSYQRTPNVKEMANLLRRNRNLYAGIKNKLGIADAVGEKDKTRVGQQKHKKAYKF